jgi:hypothetical protein
VTSWYELVVISRTQCRTPELCKLRNRPQQNIRDYAANASMRGASNRTALRSFISASFRSPIRGLRNIHTCRFSLAAATRSSAAAEFHPKTATDHCSEPLPHQLFHCERVFGGFAAHHFLDVFCYEIGFQIDRIARLERV